MKLMRRSALFFALVLTLTSSVFLVQCSDDGSSGDETDPVPCAVHEDCPEGYSCLATEGVCAVDPKAGPCQSDLDCPEDYSCYIAPDSVDGIGKCIPGGGTDGDTDSTDEPAGTCVGKACLTDANCGDVSCFCCLGKCEEKYPDCQNSRDCWPGQRCNPDSLTCEGQVPVCTEDPDGDVDTDKTDTDPSTDGDNTDGDDTDGDTPDGDSSTCDTSGDCPGDMVCGPGGVCIENCTVSGCDWGTCNPNNGYCECCDGCTASQFCNFNEDFWYCGSPCIPPCAEGQACLGDTCVPLQCPTCGANQTCSAATCFLCEDVPVDGDGERSGSSCLPANASCIEGVDTCCSGTCLMGTCL